MNAIANLTPQERMDRLVNEAHAALSAAESIADEHDLSFSWDLAYGMGGSYDGEEGEWHSSTEGCR